MRPLIPLFWTSGDRLAAPDAKAGWISDLHALSLACNGLLRFSSCVTPADLLAASMAAEAFDPHAMHMWTDIGRTRT